MPRSQLTTRYRVLIIDDEESMRLLLARIVSRDLKAEVQLAGTSVQALRLAETYAYDAILLDLLLPGMDGFEVLERIRGRTPNAATPVVVVSVLSDKASMERARELGANAYLVKPVERAELVATVRSQLAARTRRSRKEH
jgi:DNA-binding response OmpR family regulator